MSRHAVGLRTLVCFGIVAGSIAPFSSLAASDGASSGFRAATSEPEKVLAQVLKKERTDPDFEAFILRERKFGAQVAAGYKMMLTDGFLEKMAAMQKAAKKGCAKGADICGIDYLVVNCSQDPSDSPRFKIVANSDNEVTLQMAHDYGGQPPELAGTFTMVRDPARGAWKLDKVACHFADQ